MDQAGLTCKKCASVIMVGHMNKTLLAKYGTTNILSVPEIKTKRDATNLARYGTTDPLHSPEMRQKVKETNLKCY
jgi:hypothetical protein